MAENRAESAGSSQASQGGVFNWTDFRRTLNRAGLTQPRAAFQSRIGQLVEEVASAIVGISGDAGDSYYDWMMTGSFVEGWGNNLFRLDGVTGIDSDIDWSQVVKHKVYHLKETCASVVDCINRKDYDLDNGHIHVKNCSTQPAFDTKRHGLRPDTDECQAYPCCSYPKTVLVEKDGDKVDGKKVCPEFLKILRKQFDNESPVEDVHFVRASVPGESNQMRLSCTRQERFIMSQLSTVQGQLFTILKYLFKTEEEDKNGRGEGGSKKKKILEHLKSFHAKTLLMTLLRDPESWPGQSESEDLEADRLDKLVHTALEILLDSITASISEPAVSLDEVAGSSNQQEPPPPTPQVSRQTSRSSTTSDHVQAKSQIPRVLEHALLHDCGLYLKVKADKDKGSGKSNKSTEIVILHRNALREVLTDLVILLGSKRVREIENAQTGVLEHKKKMLQEVRRECQERTDEKGTLEAVLMKYQHEIESTLRKRGIRAVSQAGQDEAKFLFIPLLMLPRINLDTLLEERKQRQSKPTEGQETKATDVLSENYSPENARDVLMKAYVTVWIILKNLAAPSKRSADDPAGDKEAFEAAWKWVEDQPCLKTTFQCLRAMRRMKDGANDAEIGKILEEEHAPVRWIKLDEDFDKLVREENCIWAFHYFIRTKDRMEFPLLNDVQGVWNGEKTWLRKEPTDGGKVRHAKQEEYVDCVKKTWLTHLVFSEDHRNSKQPSLTVNFDGLLDSFRRCKRFSFQGDNTFFAFMTNCLFDPRMGDPSQ